MWYRAPRIEATSCGIELEDCVTAGTVGRLRAALGWWPSIREGGCTEGVLDLVGIAWDGPGGVNLWGWPDAEGRVEPNESSAPPEVCVSFPPAISLALALRRGGVELGARCLVLGDTYLSRLAFAVAVTMGCRVRAIPTPPVERSFEGPRPDVVIEAMGEPRGLTWSLAHCRDWGSVYSFGSALSQGPLDYYPDIHRRALTLHHVPTRPWVRPGEESIKDRGLALLAVALRDLAPDRHDVLPLRGLPQGESGVAIREREGGWCLVQVGSP